MKKKFIKIKNWFLLSMASIFGLQLSCSAPNPHNEPKCIYGPPEMLNSGRFFDDSNELIPTEDDQEATKDNNRSDSDDGFSFDDEP